MNAIVSMSVWMWMRVRVRVWVWVWVSRYLWAELLLCVNANMSNATIYNHDCWLCCFPGWKWMTWQMERSDAGTARRLRPRSQPRPPRTSTTRVRLSDSSVAVELEKTRGDSYLNNHFSDSQLDFQIGFILWPPTAFLSYLFSPFSLHSPFLIRILIFLLFSLLHALIVCLTCGRERRLSARPDSTRLVSSRIWAPHLPTSLSCGEAWAWSWASRSAWALGAARGDLFLLASFNWKRCM